MSQPVLPPDTNDHTPPLPKSLRVAVAVVVGLCVLLAGWTALTEGFLLATQTITNLAMPMGLAWVGLLVLSMMTWHQRHRFLAVLLACIFLLLTAAGSRNLGNVMFQMIEMPEPVENASSAASYDVVIVLGGSTKRSPNGTPELSCDGERVVSAAQAWHAGRTKQIICTGEDPLGVQSPAQLTEEILVSLGVPAKAILQLGGENTIGEMRSLQSHFKETPPARLGLITSSFHMKRAMRLARDHGIHADPLPVAYRSLSDRGFRVRDLVPSGPAASSVAMAGKELLAGFFGR